MLFSHIAIDNETKLMERKTKIVINRTGTQNMRKNMFGVYMGKYIVHIGLVAFRKHAEC